MDRRSLRTRASLRHALVNLILEKHYDDITVQEIIDRANVGRSTFYTHYRDKEDLFREDWERFIRFIGGGVEFEGLNAGRVVPMRELLSHLADFHAFYRALVRSGKIEQLFRLAQEQVAIRITEKLLKRVEAAGGGSVPATLAANQLSGQIFSMVRYWLDNNMSESPEEMDKMFHELVVPGLIKCLGPAE